MRCAYPCLCRLKVLAGGLVLVALASRLVAAPEGAASGGAMKHDSFYSLKATSLDGKPADLAQYSGKVTLVVNVASQCGFTPQYKGLEALHEELSPKGFSVLGFPSNDFGGQEPGSARRSAPSARRTTASASRCSPRS